MFKKFTILAATMSLLAGHIQAQNCNDESPNAYSDNGVASSMSVIIPVGALAVAAVLIATTNRHHHHSSYSSSHSATHSHAHAHAHHCGS